MTPRREPYRQKKSRSVLSVNLQATLVVLGIIGFALFMTYATNWLWPLPKEAPYETITR